MTTRKQTSLTDFFSARKRSAAEVKKLVESDEVRPAKRRKKEVAPEEVKPRLQKALKEVIPEEAKPKLQKAQKEVVLEETKPKPQKAQKEVIPEEAKPKLQKAQKEVVLEDAKPKPQKIQKEVAREEETKPKLPKVQKEVAPKEDVKPKPQKVQRENGCDTTARTYSHLAPSIDLALPSKYRFLAEVFRAVDHICSLKYNRKEVIRVADLKSSVQNALRKNFEQVHLEQIRTVFHQAFDYFWEPVLSRFGTKKSDYELQMLPNMNFEEDLRTGTMPSSGAKGTSKVFVPLMPKSLVERGRIFKNILLNIALDHHAEYLRNSHGLELAKVTAWTEGFEAQCPDIGPTPLPEKPNVVKLTTAQEVLEATKDLFGSKEKENEPASQVKVEITQQDRPTIRKELQGLPPALLEKILAKEKAKKMRELVEKDPHVEERKLLDGLLSVNVLSQIVNCYRNESARQCRGALELQPFVKFVADSHGKKSNGDVESLLRHLVKVAPQFVEIFQMNKQEYIKKKTANLSTHALREHLQKLIPKKV